MNGLSIQKYILFFCKDTYNIRGSQLCGPQSCEPYLYLTIIKYLMALRAFGEQFMISLHFQYTFYYLLSFLFFIFAAKYVT